MSRWSLPPYSGRSKPKACADAGPKDAGAESRFFEAVYPSRSPVEDIDVTGFRGRLKRGMSRALKESTRSRAEVAVLMAEALGQDTFSLASLNAYTAESNETHDISIVRFVAFVRATGALWLYDLLVADDGCIVLIGDEARFAEIARIEQARDAMEARLTELRREPVQISRRER